MARGVEDGGAAVTCRASCGWPECLSLVETVMAG